MIANNPDQEKRNLIKLNFNRTIFLNVNKVYAYFQNVIRVAPFYNKQVALSLQHYYLHLFPILITSAFKNLMNLSYNNFIFNNNNFEQLI